MNTFTETPAASQQPPYEKQPSASSTLPTNDDDKESIVTSASCRSTVDCRRVSLCLADLNNITEPELTELKESNGRPSFQKRSSILKTDRKKSKKSSSTWNRRLSIEHVFDLEQPELKPAPADGQEESATTSYSTAHSASKTDRKKSKKSSATWNRRLSIEHVFDLEQPKLKQVNRPLGSEVRSCPKPTRMIDKTDSDIS